MSEKVLNVDPYLWLEDGKEVSSWVEKENARSTEILETFPDFSALNSRFLSILNSEERLPYYKKRGDYHYDYRIDEKNKRGLWVRIQKLDSSEWEVVLDLDALSEKEQENWVWKGSIDLNGHHGLLQLSRNGSDAIVIREFDYESKQFIDDGFYLPEAKTTICWKDENTVYVSTDFGPNSMTLSGYPRCVKEWMRGTPIHEARLIFEGETTDVMAGAFPHYHGDDRFDIAYRYTSFSTSIFYLKRGDMWVPFDFPQDARFTFFQDQIILKLQSDWINKTQSFPAGAILGIDLLKYMQGEFVCSVLFKPTSRSTVTNISNTKNYLIVQILENLQNKILLFKRDGSWKLEILQMPTFGSCLISSSDYMSDCYELIHSDFLTPKRLIKGDLTDPSKTVSHSLSHHFQSEDLEVSQHFAISKDGTQIPYYQVSRKGIINDGSHPTLLHGYGGFGISLEPVYDPIAGSAWLEKGGVRILANIRGGGEFGPAWHQEAVRENRQKAFDDFIAVAEDLILRGVTHPKHLGIQGYSNGGLLMGAMLTQRPDLWGAIICQHPLLDMKRYHKLLAGASWIEEFGNPDIEEDWEYIRKYSPYQNIQKGISYPKVFFMTATSDDRVHPGHARKMAAKMIDFGCEVLFYENLDGGHAGASGNGEIAYQNALQYAFLWQALQV